MGALAIIRPQHPSRLRVFLLTLAVVDDIGALTAIAVFYTDELHVAPLLVALVALGLIALVRLMPSGRGPLYAVLSVVVWFGLHEAGVHATLAGVAVALLIPVAAPRQNDVERVVELTRAFRQSPNPAYAAAAGRQLRESISINERLQRSFAPYVAYVILPVFALANAGVVLDAETLRRSMSSSLFWGVVAGLVVGKLVGITGATLLAQRLRLGVLAPGLTIGRVAGGAALSGIGFTISARSTPGVPSCHRAPSCSARSTRAATTTRGRPTHRSCSSSTATSSARSAAGPPAWSTRSSSTSVATSSGCGGTCRSTSTTRTPSSRLAPTRRRTSRAGTSTTRGCSGPTRTSSSGSTSCATPTRSGSTSCGSRPTSTPTTCCGGCARTRTTPT